MQETWELNETRMRTRSVSQNSIRRTQDNDSRGMRAGSYVPSMIKIFNDLDKTIIGQLLTLKQLPQIDASDEERFEVLKVHIKNYCMWTSLGLPGTWPERMEDALLDRADQLQGLGIESDTSDEEEADVIAG